MKLKLESFNGVPTNENDATSKQLHLVSFNEGTQQPQIQQAQAINNGPQVLQTPAPASADFQFQVNALETQRQAKANEVASYMSGTPEWNKATQELQDIYNQLNNIKTTNYYAKNDANKQLMGSQYDDVLNNLALQQERNRIVANQSIGNNPRVTDANVARLNEINKALASYQAPTVGNVDMAREYAKRELNAKQMQQDVASSKAFGQSNPVSATVSSVGSNLISGGGAIKAVGNSVANMFRSAENFVPLDTNSEAFKMTQMTNAMREGVKDNIEGKLKDNPNSWWAKNGALTGDQSRASWAYDVGTSMLDSTANMLVGMGIAGAVAGAKGVADQAVIRTMAGNIVNATMSSQSASSAILDNLEKGYTQQEAISLGIISGLIEGITEKYSVETIIGNPNSLIGKGVNSIIKNPTANPLIKSFLSEGGEEVASNWLNRVVYTLVNANIVDERNLANAFAEVRKESSSDAEAIAKIVLTLLKEDASSFLAGGISGLGMGTVSATKNYVGNVAEGKAIRTQDQQGYSNARENIIKEASKTLDNKYAQKLANRENLSNAQLGYLSKSYTSNLAETALRKTAQEQGVSKEVENAIVQKAMEGETSKSNENLIKESKLEEDIFNKASEAFTKTVKETEGKIVEAYGQELVDSIKASGRQIMEVDFGELSKTDNSINAEGIGFEKDGVIYVNKNAKQSEKFRQVLIHELGHLLEGTNAYNELKTSFLNSLENKAEAIKKYQKDFEEFTNGKSISEQEVEHELFVDYLGDILQNSNNINRIIRGEKEAKTLLSTIKKFKDKFSNKQSTEMDKLENALESMLSSSKSIETNDKNSEGQGIRRTRPSLDADANRYRRKSEEIRKLGNDKNKEQQLDGITKRDNGKGIIPIKADSKETGLTYDNDLDTTYRYSINYITPKDKINKLAEILASKNNTTLEQAKKFIKDEDSLAYLISMDDNSRYLDYTPDDRYSWLKKNSDYPQGTIDFTNNCRKRIEYTELFTALQNDYPNIVFYPSDLETVRQVMIDNGMTVPCGGCYVEDRRQHVGEIAYKFISEMESHTLKQEIESVLDRNDTYKPTLADLTTYEGLKALSKTHPTIANAFVKFNNARGMQAGRLIEGRAEYNREILKWTKSMVDRKNSFGGLRISSYSDLEAQHVIDIYQILMDASTKDLMIQGYTKVPSFAKMIRNTGVKMLRSHIPYGTGVKTDGTLLFDPVEGINFNDADFFDSIDDINIGNNVIGINDRQIRSAMKNSYIDQVIPFHSSLTKEIREQKNIGHWVNYKDASNQGELDKTTRKAVDKNINFYTEVIEQAKKDGNPIKNKRDFVEKFFAVSKEKNQIPRFENFINKDSKGNYIYTEGYEKLLVDYKLFDKNGNIIPQTAVNPNIDMGVAKRFLLEHVNAEKNRKFNDKVYKDIVKELDLDNRKFSISTMDSEGNELSEGQQEYFKDSKIVNDSGKLIRMFHGTPSKFGFTVFKPSKSDDKLSLFFTDKINVASSYSDGSPNPFAENPDKQQSFETLKNAIESYGVSVEKKGGKIVVDNEGDISEFSNDRELQTFFFDELVNKDMANDNSGIYSVYLNITNPLIVDAKGQQWDKLPQYVFLETAKKYNNFATIEDYKKFISDKDFNVSISLSKDGRKYFFTNNKTGNNFFTLSKYDLEGEPVFSFKDFCDELDYDNNFMTNGLDFYAFADKVGERSGSGEGYTTTREYAKWAKELGYNGVLFKNIFDVGQYNEDGEFSNVAIAFRSNQVKSTDNKNPTKNSDIRYSIEKDSKGNKLSEGQTDFFASSKMRDIKGRLMPMNHGTRHFGFTIFDPKESDDGRSLFFASDPRMSQSYIGNGEQEIERLSRDVENKKVIDKIKAESLSLEEYVNEVNRELGYDKYIQTSQEEVADNILKLANEVSPTITKLVETYRKSMGLVEKDKESFDSDNNRLMDKAKEEFHAILSFDDFFKGDIGNRYVGQTNVSNASNAYRHLDGIIGHSYEMNRLLQELSGEGFDDEYDANTAIDILEELKWKTSKNAYFSSKNVLLHPSKVWMNKGEDGKLLGVADEGFFRNMKSKGSDIDGIYEVYLNLVNPLVIDANKKHWNSLYYYDLLKNYNQMASDAEQREIFHVGDKVPYILEDDDGNPIPMKYGLALIYPNYTVGVMETIRADERNDYDGTIIHDVASGFSQNYFHKIINGEAIPFEITDNGNVKLMEEWVDLDNDKREKIIDSINSVWLNWTDYAPIKEAQEKRFAKASESIKGLTDLNKLKENHWERSEHSYDYDTRAVSKWAKDNGYDGVIIRNVRDNGGRGEGFKKTATVAIAFDPNQVKSTANLEPTLGNDDIRYSTSKLADEKLYKNLQRTKDDGENGTYKLMTLSPKRFEDELGRNSATIPHYARAYVAWVKPMDFLKATTPNKEVLQKIFDQSHELNIDELSKEPQTPTLWIDLKNGNVDSHEGRHRMVALYNAGYDYVAVLLADTKYKYESQPIHFLNLKGQVWNEEKDKDIFTRGFTITNALPLSREYGDKAREYFVDINNATKYSISSVTEEAKEFADTDVKFSIRTSSPPNKVGIGYKVFVLKDGKLYPPMVNPSGKDTPIGVWLDAEEGKLAGTSKTGRLQVQGGGQGTSTSKVQLSYRPGWHLGDIPKAEQFYRVNKETGIKEFPSNFVWGECEYSMDNDYQDEAYKNGLTENGKYRHAYAGLTRMPTDGYYKYRTNPNPNTVPWIITGTMKVNRILDNEEVARICRENGVEPQPVQRSYSITRIGDSESASERAMYSAKVETSEAKLRDQAIDNAYASVKSLIEDLKQQVNEGTVQSQDYKSIEDAYKEIIKLEKQKARDDQKLKDMDKAERKEYQDFWKKELDKADVKLDKEVAKLKAKEIVDKYQEQIKNARERRKRSQESQQLLRALKQLKAMRNKVNPNFQAQIDDIIGDINLFGTNVLKNGYVKNDGTFVRGEIDLQNLLDRLEEREKDNNFINDKSYKEYKEWVSRFNKRQIGNMPLEDIERLLESATALRHQILTYNQTVGETQDREMYAIAKSVASEVESSKKRKIGNLTNFSIDTLRPKTFFKQLGGFSNGALEGMYQELENGQTKYIDYVMKSTKPFDDFVERNPEAKKWGGRDADLIEVQLGDRKLKINKMMRISLYMHLQNDDNMKHIVNGGIVVPDMKLYNEGKIKDAYDRGVTVKATKEILKDLVGYMSPKELEFADLMKKHFKNASVEINNTSMALDGYEKATVENYYPIQSDKSYLKSNFDSIVRDFRLENTGSLKAREGGANPIILEDANNVLTRQIETMGRYVGFAVPLRNFKRMYDFHIDGESINRKISRQSTQYGNYIEHLIAQINGNNGKTSDFSKFSGNYASAVLNFNPSVALSQTASYPTAMAVLGEKALRKGLTMGKVDTEIMAKYTPLYWYRTKGYIDNSLSAVKNASSWVQKLPGTKWIQAMDLLTTRTLWNASQAWVQDNTDLKQGTDAYWQKVAEMYNRTIYDTQPNYTVMQRPEVLRSDSELVRQLFMFKTQSYQNYNMLYESLGEMIAKKGTAQEGQARKQAFVTASTLLIANAVFTAFKNLVKMARNKKDEDWFDEDGDLRILKWLMDNYFSNALGSIPLGSEVFEAINFNNASYDTFTIPAVEVINSMISAYQVFESDIVKAISSGSPIVYFRQNRAKMMKDIWSLSKKISQFAGIPLDNVAKYIGGIVSWFMPEVTKAINNTINPVKKNDIAFSYEFDLLMKNELGFTNDKLYNLYQKAGDMVLPSFDVSNSSYGLTITQQYDVKEDYKKNVKSIFNTMFNMQGFKSLNSDQQAHCVVNAYSYAKEMALSKVNKDYPKTKWIKEAKSSPSSYIINKNKTYKK